MDFSRYLSWPQGSCEINVKTPTRSFSNYSVLRRHFLIQAPQQLISNLVPEVLNPQGAAQDQALRYNLLFEPRSELIKKNFITGTVTLGDVPLSLFLLCCSKKLHTQQLSTPPSASTSPHFPVAATGGSWGFSGEQDSTAAQKSPTGVLLTGCRLSSVPMSARPSPHLGWWFERSTGGRLENCRPSTVMQ